MDSLVTADSSGHTQAPIDVWFWMSFCDYWLLFPLSLSMLSVWLGEVHQTINSTFMPIWNQICADTAVICVEVRRYYLYSYSRIYTSKIQFFRFYLTQQLSWSIKIMLLNLTIDYTMKFWWPVLREDQLICMISDGGMLHSSLLLLRGSPAVIADLCCMLSL